MEEDYQASSGIKNFRFSFVLLEIFHWSTWILENEYTDEAMFQDVKEKRSFRRFKTFQIANRTKVSSNGF